jgi:hypothetical protein
METKLFQAFTVVSKETPGYFRLLRSAERWGWNLRTFWAQDLGDPEAFIEMKHLRILEALNQIDARHFLFVDGWDTIFVRPCTMPVVAKGLNFGGEMNCYPEEGYAPFFLPKTQGNFPYLNSGIIWGEVDAYHLYAPSFKAHDQLAWTRTSMNFPNKLSIDTKAQIGLNLHSVKNEDLMRTREGLVNYLPHNSFPVVVHGNGTWPIPLWMGE